MAARYSTARRHRTPSGRRPNRSGGAARSKSIAEGLAMDRIGSTAKAKVIDRMTGPVGLNAFLAALSDGSIGDFDASRIRKHNVAQELAERAEPVQYPAMHVY